MATQNSAYTISLLGWQIKAILEDRRTQFSVPMEPQPLGKLIIQRKAV